MDALKKLLAEEKAKKRKSLEDKGLTVCSSTVWTEQPMF